MPEGPSIVILREQTKKFKRKKIYGASGSKEEITGRVRNQTIIDFKSWGKHFLICFKDFYLRIHLMMFGSYRIDEKKDRKAQLHLKFVNGELNFYSCSVKLFEGDVNKDYKWDNDVMSDEWNPQKAERKMKKLRETKIADALLDQDIFSGVGNIIKNEVLFRTRVHPESDVEAIPKKTLKDIIRDARDYSFEFYKWKKIFQLRKNWNVYRKPKCPRCNSKIIMQYTGERHRLSFFCTNCQTLFHNK